MSFLAQAPRGNVALPDFEQKPVSARRTYSRPIRHQTIHVPQLTSASTQWNEPIDVQTPSVFRLRSRPSNTPAAGVETIELWYAPDPPPLTISDGIAAAGGAAYFSTPGVWWWQVVCPQVANLDLDYNLLDFDTDQAALAELDKPQATTFLPFNKSIPITSDAVLLPANQNVERKRVRLTLTTGGGPTVWINLGQVASATMNCGFLGALGATLDFDARILPLYSIHGFNTSATSPAVVSVAVYG
jgi:hypothetical protein